MNSKEKIKIILIICSIVLVAITLICVIAKTEKTVYAVTTDESEEFLSSTNIQNVQISNAKEINLDDIIQKNTSENAYREEITVEQTELEYITKYRNNNELYVGTTQVSQEGRKGVQAITTKRTYDENGELISEEQVSAVVVKGTINKIIDIGTKEYPKVTTENGITKSDITDLNFNMALNTPSGFTLEQFEEMLTDSKDKNNIFKENAKYFYYIEQEYNINGVFVAAVGIHESGWGTSKIAVNKNNLFGYGAYDSNPYNGAYTFESYSESIDLIARVFVKYYLNQSGTKIYDNETASGRYYSGNTLTAVNKKYASDQNWASSVYKHMQYLYNKVN